MDILAEQLDAKLRYWQPETAQQVRQCIAEIIDLADQDTLDVLRSRGVEQEIVETLYGFQTARRERRSVAL